VTEVKGYGSASDVKNVNPQTDAFMKQIMGLMGGIQESAMDPMGAFMKALPGLFEQAVGANSPYAKAAQDYANAITPGAVKAAITPYNEENAYYSSGAAGAAGKAAAEVQAGAAKDIMAMQTQLAGQLAGAGAGLLQSQQGLFGQLAGVGGSLAAPEYWQPTYVQQNTWLGDLMGYVSSNAATGATVLGAML
jgi:hypothetical protein